MRSRLIFFISLHTIRLPFETTGDAVCRLFCISLIRLHNSTAWRRHLPFWYWEGIVRISLNQSQSWQIVEESLEVQWRHLTPKVSIQGVRLLHFSDPEALPICYTVNGLHTHTHTYIQTPMHAELVMTVCPHGRVSIVCLSDGHGVSAEGEINKGEGIREMLRLRFPHIWRGSKCSVPLPSSLDSHSLTLC